ncbi:unnamed protein product [Blepharisma stoltei]|uniref:Uncharacterized protein n=1 Tax=Blepharisma stoltei TaxID=1481888 RepID=A0AAU9J2Z6_9CILI|nr:unnamed protein product [Blepharisma stoltei]
MENHQERVLSHLAGPLWNEFERQYYGDLTIEDHQILLTEVFSLHEIAKEHLNVLFEIPKANLDEALISEINSSEVWESQTAMKILKIETEYLKNLTEKLQNILLMPKEQAKKMIQAQFPYKPAVKPTKKRTPRGMRLLKRLGAKQPKDTTKYTCNFDYIKAESMLKAMYEKF